MHYRYLRARADASLSVPSAIRRTILLLVNRSGFMFPNVFTAPLRIADLFSDPFRFAVPPYQRRFAWTVKEASQLMDDIQMALGGEDEPAEPDYFLGAILLTDAGRGADWSGGLPRSPRVLDIVDGQQRLITLMMLLAGLRDLEEDGASGGRGRDDLLAVPEKAAGAARAYRIQLAADDNAFMIENALLPGSTLIVPRESDSLDAVYKNVVEVRDHLVNELSNLEPEGRSRLKNYILQQCHVVTIVTTDIDHGHRIFTGLNDRGRPLARKDIIKAEILSGVPTGRLDMVLTRWCQAENQLGTDFENFFSHARTIRGKGKLPIIAGIRSAVAEAGGSEPFVTDVLIPLSDAFDLIRRARHEGAPQSEAINRRLTYLNWLGSSEWVPATMLWLSEHRGSPAEILRFLELIERFAYSLRLLCIGAGKRTARFSGVLSAISRGTIFDAERSPCTLSREEQRHIAHNLRNLHERHPQTCKLVLLRLNDELAGSPQSLDLADWTVEHVLPQSPGRVGQWRTWFPDPDERSATWCSRRVPRTTRRAIRTSTARNRSTSSLVARSCRPSHAISRRRQSGRRSRSARARNAF